MRFLLTVLVSACNTAYPMLIVGISAQAAFHLTWQQTCVVASAIGFCTWRDNVSRA